MSTPLRTVLLLLALAPALPGCASLYAQPGDSGALRAAKATTRVVLGVPTLGLSEAVIGLNARHRARLAHARELTARYDAAQRELASARTREEWDRALPAVEQAWAEIHHHHAELAAAERRGLAVEPFAAIRTVRNRIEAAQLPPLPPPPAAGVDFPKVLPTP